LKVKSHKDISAIIKNMEIISINTIIENIVKDNKITRFSSELQYSNFGGEERKNKIREILKRLSNNNSEHEKSNKAKDDIANLCNIVNENALKKKWIKLTLDQKTGQIEKYFKLKIDDAELCLKEVDKIIDMIKNDKITNKSFTYNEKEGKLEDIKLNEK
jgi:hypothetical protein